MAELIAKSLQTRYQEFDVVSGARRIVLQATAQASE
jgi:hypothetical protein